MTPKINKFHPVTALVYYLGLLYVSTSFLNPVFLIGIIINLTCINYLTDKLERANQFKIMMIFMFIFISIINPLTSSRGRTLLFYIYSRAVTLESILYGITFGLSLNAVILSFSSFNAIVNGEKLIYLFSGISKNLALMVVMVLRYIPLFAKRYKETAENIEFNSVSEGKISFVKKITNPFSILTCVFSRSLEDGFDTSVSMKARGFGISKKRSFYSDFKFKKTDLYYVLLMLGCIFIICFLWLAKLSYFTIYPKIFTTTDIFYNCSFYISAFLFINIPFLMEVFN